MMTQPCDLRLGPSTGMLTWETPDSGLEPRSPHPHPCPESVSRVQPRESRGACKGGRPPPQGLCVLGSRGQDIARGPAGSPSAWGACGCAVRGLRGAASLRRRSGSGASGAPEPGARRTRGGDTRRGHGLASAWVACHCALLGGSLSRSFPGLSCFPRARLVQGPRWPQTSCAGVTQAGRAELVRSESAAGGRRPSPRGDRGARPRLRHRSWEKLAERLRVQPPLARRGAERSCLQTAGAGRTPAGDRAWRLRPTLRPVLAAAGVAPADAEWGQPPPRRVSIPRAGEWPGSMSGEYQTPRGRSFGV